VGDSVAGFDPKQIGKSDIDRVADLHRREIFASVRVLAEKALPAQSARMEEGRPRQRRGGARSPARSAHRLASGRGRGPRGTDAILLALCVPTSPATASRSSSPAWAAC
jgi:hypothetical protein